jgi:hypothetical protein
LHSSFSRLHHHEFLASSLIFSNSTWLAFMFPRPLAASFSFYELV